MKPVKQGYLKNENHQIYYAVYGNLKGKTWMFCHGGPGYHTNPSSNLKFFDLKKDCVILFDQRGAGKSKPHSELHKNTTQGIVDDMVKILDLLKIKKVHLLGGSWGSTLALLFSISYPEKVCSMVIRGIFLARKKDIEGIYYPRKEWSAEQTEKYNLTLAYLKKKFKLKDIFDGLKILKKKNKDSLIFAKYWAFYEDLLCDRGFKILDFDHEYLQMAMAISSIEMHYFVNHCFIPENYILHNIKKIEHIPVYIVQGGDDMVCPKEQALLLSMKMKNCELYLDPKGGHSSSPSMTKAMKSMVKKARLSE